MRRRSRGDRVQGVRLNPHIVDGSATLDRDARAMDDMDFCNVVDVPYVRRMMFMAPRTTDAWASTVVVEAVGGGVLNPKVHQLNPTSQRRVHSRVARDGDSVARAFVDVLRLSREDGASTNDGATRTWMGERRSGVDGVHAWNTSGWTTTRVETTRLTTSASCARRARRRNRRIS